MGRRPAFVPLNRRPAGSWVFSALFRGVTRQLGWLVYTPYRTRQTSYISKFEFRNIVNKIAYLVSANAGASLPTAAPIRIQILVKKLGQES